MKTINLHKLLNMAEFATWNGFDCRNLQAKSFDTMYAR